MPVLYTRSIDAESLPPSRSAPPTQGGLRRASAWAVRWLGSPYGAGQVRFLSRSIGAGFLLSAAVGSIALAFPKAPGAHLGLEVLCALLVTASGLVLVLFGEKMPSRWYAGVVVWAVLLAALVDYAGGGILAGGEFFFFWSIPYAYAFLSLRLALLLTTLMAVSSGAVLSFGNRPGVVPLRELGGFWFLCLAASVVVGVLVRRLGRSLRDVDQRFHKAFEQSPVAAAFLTTEGTLLEVNDAFCDLLGRQRSDLVGTSMPALTDSSAGSSGASSGASSGGGAAGGAPVSAALAGSSELQYERRFVRPDGTVVCSLVSEAVIAPEVGEPYQFSQCQDITSHKADREELSRRAVHDPLTGLFNRTLLLERLAETPARHAANGRTAVVMLDLDQFKLVNDSLGHHVGDELLVQLAPRLASAVMAGDTLARFGGDEFVVLCAGVRDVDDALGRARRLAGTLREPIRLTSGNYEVSASIGVAVSDGQDDLAGMLRDADAAMYRAKSSGRNRIELFDESMREASRSRLELEHSLRSAPRNGELFLHYQPIVELFSGSPIAVEALVRWNHPELGVLDPGRFIHVAEEIGAIHELGEWVLVQALDDLERLQRSLGGSPLRVNVNVSARQLLAGDFLAQVRRELTSRRLPAGTLGIEITESVLIPDTLAVGLLQSLRSLGAVIVVDDFGTGYSSLAYLDQFPVDVLKVDQSFVARLLEGGGRAAVLEAILALGAALGLQVIAEGVETNSQVQRLRQLGCAAVQGNALAVPLPLEDVTRFCAEARMLSRAL